MFIKSLAYNDKELLWELTKTDFERFTLLLGLSGVGKSKILDAILNLKEFALGRPVMLGGVNFDISFVIHQETYRWTGSIDSLDMPYLKSRHRRQITRALGQSDMAAPNVLEESFFAGETCIFKRSETGATLRGKPITLAPSDKSMFELFKEDERFSLIRDEFLSIFRIDFSGEMNILIDKRMVDIMQNTKERSVITSDCPVIQKLAYCYLNDKKTFDQIRFQFIDVFPHVEDIFFEYAYNDEYFILVMKERNTSNITQSYISSGMFKTLMFITQLNLLEGFCVVLIDEVENSLGLNCIDLLTDELRRNQSNDQFLITTHHPYIINNVDMSHWRIVSRKGGRVTTNTAKELRLGNSSHESYFQLINASEYSEGIQ